MAPHDDSHGAVSRRRFLIAGGAAAAASAVPRIGTAEEADEKPRIKRFRTLGRTGFEVSDISIGGAAKEANVYRYAYDHGINYIDSAESYGNGDNERKVGEALQHMDRKKVFITTKLWIEASDTLEKILDRFGKCQDRLRTDSVDALYMHSVPTVALLGHAGFHEAVRTLKADGRLRFAGVSNHGPDADGEEPMDDVLVAAAEDGRFDLMLIAYNFMNRDKGDRVLAACKKNNVGTTAMKTAPGSIEMPPFDPENPAKRYADYIKRKVDEGETREQAEETIKGWIADNEKAYADATPFMKEHGITNRNELRVAGVQWVLSNPEMHTACIGFRDFESIDTLLPLSGTKITRNRALALDRYRVAASSLYCRHGCTDCAAACPHAVPVSTVMRYAYYFTEQGREKHAMAKYAGLPGSSGGTCAGCVGVCVGACPHGVNIQANMLAAHDVLTLA